MNLGGMGREVVGTANQSMSISFWFSTWVPCQKNTLCNIALEYGTDIQGKLGCLVARQVQGNNLDTGILTGYASGQFPFGASGLYHVRLNGANVGMCSNGWTGPPPMDDATIAIVCVP
jgi:hypothetical protein